MPEASLFFNAPLSVWEFDGIPSMEGEADLSFASSISRSFLFCETLRHLQMVCLSADFRRRRELETPIAPSHALSGALSFLQRFTDQAALRSP